MSLALTDMVNPIYMLKNVWIMLFEFSLCSFFVILPDYITSQVFDFVSCTVP